MFVGSSQLKFAFLFLACALMGIFLTPENYLALLVFLALGGCFLFLSMSAKFTVLSLLAFFPLGIGPWANKEILLIECIAPLVLINVVIVVIMRKLTLILRKALVFLIPLGVFLLIVLYHFLLHPVSAEVLGEHSTHNRGLRLYYTVMVSLCIYLSSLWITSYYTIRANLWLRWIVFFSISLGVIRLASYLCGIEVPFLYGTFGYAGEPFHSPGGLIHRIGGLDTVGMIGLPALIAMYYGRKLDLLGILGFNILIVLTLAGGGRTQAIAMLGTIFVYMIAVNKRAITSFTMVLLGGVLVAFLTLSTLNLPKQFQRLTSFGGSFGETDPYREATFKTYWETFLEHPIAGKGFGEMKLYGLEREYESFVLVQIVGGGHGAYVSMLAIFGLVGIFFLVNLLIGTIVFGFRVIQDRNTKFRISFPGDANLAVFSILYILNASLRYISGYAGYDDFALFIVAGMVCGLRSKQCDALFERNQEIN